MSSITPALSSTEWSRFETTGEARLPIRGGVRRDDLGDIAIWTYGTVSVPKEAAPALIAILNDMMSSYDERRIRRSMVEALREAAASHDQEQAVLDITHVADVLEAYLKPDGPPELQYVPR